MASESLPYIDTHYSVPAVKEHVDALIAAEMGRVQSARTHPALSAYPDVPIFSHNPYLARRLDRVSQKGEAEEDEEEEGVDMAAYALPAMDTNGSAIIGADEWHAAVHRAVTLLEHQRTRVENLELMAVYGANQWLYHLHQTDARVQQLEATRDTLAAQVEVLNATRKDEQVRFSNDFNCGWKPDDFLWKNIVVGG
ncbi:Pre-mRNA-splicing factor SPF27 [Blastocladiella britannica]|nr:Pre-mRNA-splicing factor SPF27 [Blastocladiella britannica]